MATGGDDDFAVKSQAFMSWLAAQPNATINPNIQLADYRTRHAGRGVQALTDIPADTDLFSIPRRAILSVHTSDLPTKLPAIFAAAANAADPSDSSDEDDGALGPWTALILVLIYEHLRPDSPWQPYLDVLPVHFDTLMFWSSEELDALQGCAVARKIGKEAADDEFRRNVVPVVQAHRDVFNFGTPDEDTATTSAKEEEEAILALAHRMASTIMSYAFDIERDAADATADDDGYITDEDDDALAKGMVPLADMLNADAAPNASLFYSAGALTMKTLRAVRAGDEILNDYGQVPRADLLRRFGYTTPRYAPFDTAEVATAALLAAVRAHGATDPTDLDRRVAWLGKQALLEDAYELAWPDNGGDRFCLSAGLSCFVRTLLIDQAHFKVPAADPEGGAVPDADLRGVLVPVLEARLGEYAGDLDVDPELLKDAEVTGRWRMAIEVRHGEMKLLRAAVDSLKASANPGNEPQSKKRKLG